MASSGDFNFEGSSVVVAGCRCTQATEQQKQRLSRNRIEPLGKWQNIHYAAV